MSVDGNGALKKAIVELYKLYDNVRTLQWNGSHPEQVHRPSVCLLLVVSL